ncbi:MAG: 2-oxoacid:acceptor oxidoreductase family protein [Actinobacteria bacterium]|nr:2-oxoacid:acceptor oxidoreductase family protein [Actinomycetota bacterium]
MEDVLEIRWHGRGGQGAVTASKLLASAALEEGYYIQAFPEYGAERMGAPVQSFNRISKEPIELHCQVREPEIVLVLDATLLKSIDVCEGIKEGGILIVNTPKTPDEIRKLLNFNGKEIKVYTVDATRISIETMGRAMPNTPMIGALARVTDFLKLDSLLANVKKSLAKRFTEEVVEGNLNAIKKAYEEVKD